jgi:UDP-N-acetylglucosamine--N-acetylmuramyl-(pentapeptide) pyrophosphoryl-undecaprenol N-acetylglucosamine transferase
MSRHLVIMAAGTGGHIMPGLAVAREMQRRGWTVSWLGTNAGMENRLVPSTGIPLDTVPFAGVRGKGLVQGAKGAVGMAQAFAASLRVFGQRSADAVLGMGGYVCVPGGLAAKLKRLPLMLVNADASLLMSNRALLPLVDRIGFGFDGMAASTTRRALVTGNPVRTEIEAIAAPEQRLAGRRGPLRILVVGGSLGAKVLNETLPAALALIPVAERPAVTHQTGAGHFESVRDAYTKAGVGAEILPFIDDMAQRLARCDLIVCRAGAITVSELCAAGVPSILVPLVISTTAHQRDNARFMAQHHAAIHLPQEQMNPAELARILRETTREQLLAMATAAHKLSRPKAAERVADEIEALVTSQRRGAA